MTEELQGDFTVLPSGQVGVGWDAGWDIDRDVRRTVERAVDDGPWVAVHAPEVDELEWLDTSAPAGRLRYRVRTEGLDGGHLSTVELEEFAHDVGITPEDLPPLARGGRGGGAATPEALTLAAATPADAAVACADQGGHYLLADPVEVDGLRWHGGYRYPSCLTGLPATIEMLSRTTGSTEWTCAEDELLAALVAARPAPTLVVLPTGVVAAGTAATLTDLLDGLERQGRLFGCRFVTVTLVGLDAGPRPVTVAAHPLGGATPISAERYQELVAHGGFAPRRIRVEDGTVRDD